MPSIHLILCCPLLLPPSIFPSIKVFSNESVLHIRWPNTGVSASTSVLPMTIQDWSPLGWTGWIFLLPKGLSRVFSNTTIQKRQFFGTQLSLREGNGIPLQYSCLENPMDRGAWWATIHGVAQSWTRLRDFTFTFHFHALEKEMATHSSVLAWKIPGMGEPGRLLSMRSHRVGHFWSDLACTQSLFKTTCLLTDYIQFDREKRQKSNLKTHKNDCFSSMVTAPIK